MRSVNLPGTDLHSSALGFGCASLGSRIGRRAGLRALNDAFVNGVTWYDVAPPYGAGEAESILGEFLRGRRDRVLLCTKAGLLGPAHGKLVKLVYALARPVVGQAKKLRRGFRSVAATRYRKDPLDGATIVRSVERSLQRLGTDYVDVFALHDPSPEDVVNDDVLRGLEDIVTSGKARYLSVAGTLAPCLAGFEDGRPYSLAQIADDPLAGSLAELRSRSVRQPAAITHSVFGVDGMLERLVGIVEDDVSARCALADAGYAGQPSRKAADLLLDRAFASNPDGVVLTSMFGARHRDANIARASAPLNLDAIGLLDAVLAKAKTS